MCMVWLPALVSSALRGFPRNGMSGCMAGISSRPIAVLRVQA